jgi:GTPase SAR1 family protein
LDSLVDWKEEVESKIGVVSNMFVGNKLDLINDENNFINTKEVDNFRELLSASAYVETSAKLGTNVKNVFDELALEMYKKTNF